MWETLCRLGVGQLHVVMSAYNVTNTKHIQKCDKLRSFLNAQLIHMSSSHRNDVQCTIHGSSTQASTHYRVMCP